MTLNEKNRLVAAVVALCALIAGTGLGSMVGPLPPWFLALGGIIGVIGFVVSFMYKDIPPTDDEN